MRHKRRGRPRALLAERDEVPAGLKFQSFQFSDVGRLSDCQKSALNEGITPTPAIDRLPQDVRDGVCRFEDLASFYHGFKKEGKSDEEAWKLTWSAYRKEEASRRNDENYKIELRRSIDQQRGKPVVNEHVVRLALSRILSDPAIGLNRQEQFLVEVRLFGEWQTAGQHRDVWFHEMYNRLADRPNDRRSLRTCQSLISLKHTPDVFRRIAVRIVNRIPAVKAKYQRELIILAMASANYSALDFLELGEND